MAKVILQGETRGTPNPYGADVIKITIVGKDNELKKLAEKMGKLLDFFRQG